MQRDQDRRREAAREVQRRAAALRSGRAGAGHRKLGRRRATHRTSKDLATVPGHIKPKLIKNISFFGFRETAMPA